MCVSRWKADWTHSSWNSSDKLARKVFQLSGRENLVFVTFMLAAQRPQVSRLLCLLVKLRHQGTNDLKLFELRTG